jgi:nitrite reductase/ring-hydroxylating ferredoxin subunit
MRGWSLSLAAFAGWYEHGPVHFWRARPGVGMHPAERAVPPGATLDVTFWNSSIVVYRGRDRRLRALENRCAHRQLKLSEGEVNDCHLTCVYHGWTYDGDGHVVHYAHDLFGRAQPEVRVRSFPVTTKHGLIWIFPGDPALAPRRDIPTPICTAGTSTGGIIKHWCFVLPIDRTTTRVFFVFYFDAFRIPLLNVRMPRLMMKAAMRLGAALSVRPLLRQDGWAVESEQVGYEANFEAPIVELNPAVHLF